MVSTTEYEFLVPWGGDNLLIGIGLSNWGESDSLSFEDDCLNDLNSAIYNAVVIDVRAIVSVTSSTVIVLKPVTTK